MRQRERASASMVPIHGCLVQLIIFLSWSWLIFPVTPFTMDDLQAIFPGVNLYNVSELSLYSASVSRLSGTIPPELGLLTNLTRLSFYYLNLVGPIPPELGNLKRLRSLTLRFLGLSGSIPPQLGNLTNLQSLDLSLNQLSGNIPPQLGSLTNLQYLYLFDNQLSGNIPSQLGNLARLQVCTLSNNNLSGPVASSISRFGKDSILTGNPNLLWPSRSAPLGITIGVVVAGAILLLLAVSFGILCVRRRRKQRLQAGVAQEKLEDVEDGIEDPLSSAGTFPSAPQYPPPPKPVSTPPSTTYPQSSTSLKPIPQPPPKPLMSEPPVLPPQPASSPQTEQVTKPNSPLPRHQGSYSLNELREGTDGFSEANVVGRGSFGVVYKATLVGRPNRVVAVKRLLQRPGRGDLEERSWRAEVGALEKVRHKNLVPLLGVCLESGECLLVLEFFPRGSLGAQLQAARAAGGPALTWEERTGVICDIARGLNYLHNDIQPPILHRDIKAGNILLAEGSPVHACITDFGLAHLVSGAGGQTTSSMVKGTVPYMAPEYLHGGARFLSAKCDVYSFGVVCLEVLSGRPVVRQLESGVVERLSETAEEYARDGRPLELMDPLLGGAYDATEAQRYVAVALSCLCQDPSRRPAMDQVWWQLSKQAALTDPNAAAANQSAGSAWNFDGSGSLLSGNYDLGSRQLASTVQVESRFLTPR